MHPDFKFRDRIKWAEGVEEKLPNAARKRMEWGAWFELKDEGEDVRESAVMMPFFSDMFVIIILSLSSSHFRTGLNTENQCIIRSGSRTDLKRYPKDQLPDLRTSTFFSLLS